MSTVSRFENQQQQEDRQVRRKRKREREIFVYAQEGLCVCGVCWYVFLSFLSACEC